jgi:protein-S-isoprenylcysteine O-methyltransferase Ste14
MNIGNYLVEFVVKRSAKKHNAAIITLATLTGVVFFAAGWPALVYVFGEYVLANSILNQQASIALAVVCFIFGIFWMLWAVLWQIVYGKGTPVPVVPTVNFLQNGPYRYVRNPMILGYSFYLLGWAFLFNNAGAILSAAVLIVFFLVEVKVIEEKELEKRFGQIYSDYKKETPFLLPSWRSKK